MPALPALSPSNTLPQAFIPLLSPELSPARSSNVFKIECSRVIIWKYMSKEDFCRE